MPPVIVVSAVDATRKDGTTVKHALMAWQSLYPPLPNVPCSKYSARLKAVEPGDK